MFYFINNVLGTLTAAFLNDIKLAIVYDPPLMKYVPMTYNQIFFRIIRTLIMGCVCIWLVLLTCFTIDYTVSHMDSIVRYMFWIKIH